MAAGGRTAAILAATAALAAGLAAGWLTGRASERRAPPPPEYVNPLADARKGEVLALVRTGDRAVSSFRVVQADDATVLLSVETAPPGQPSTMRELRVARSFFGPFVVLEGDLRPEEAAAMITEFVLERVGPETVYVESMGRPFRCWKFTGRHRQHGTMEFWVSDEVPVHGIVRIATPKGIQWEIHGR